MTKRALIMLLAALDDDVELMCWDEHANVWHSAIAMIEKSPRTGITTVYLRPETSLELIARKALTEVE